MKTTKAYILRQVSKALEYQFETYSWENMINDIQDLTLEEKRWAKDHTSYKAYIYK